MTIVIVRIDYTHATFKASLLEWPLDKLIAVGDEGAGRMVWRSLSHHSIQVHFGEVSP